MANAQSLPPERWYEEMWLHDSEEGQAKAHECYEDGTKTHVSTWGTCGAQEAAVPSPKP